MNGWASDKKWSDVFLPQIKAIIGQTFIVEPPATEDQEHNTDLIVLKMDPIRVACRIRRERYYQQYADEFTIRCSRPSGIKTELSKIIEGWGDYLFYGFGDESLIAYRIGDLKVFRLWFTRYLSQNGGTTPGLFKKNADGSSNFIAFKWSELPQNFIVKTI